GSSGLLTGTPAVGDIGAVAFTVTATDNQGGTGATANHAYSFTVTPAVAITTASLPNADVGTAYSETIATTGGNGGNTFSITAGSLPSWLTLDTNTGDLTGTPAVADIG